MLAVTDYVRAVPEQIRAWLPAGRRYATPGTDGFGRSDTRAQLRSYFEVDRQHILLRALRLLVDAGEIPRSRLEAAGQQYGWVPGGPDPWAG